jgi:putative transferase (TIGR04331 family)
LNNINLITTSLIESWPSEESNVIFLGEWCKLFSIKDKWSRYNHSTLLYHWDDREKLFQDYQYLEVIYERCLEDLTYQLNKVHGINYNISYWRIIIGPWLFYFIHIVFDRHYMINKFLLENQEFSTIIIKYEDYLVPSNFQHFINLFIHDYWNLYIYSYILNYYNKGNLIYKNIKTNINIYEESKNNNFSTRQILSILKRKILSRKDSFIISPYINNDSKNELYKLLKQDNFPYSSINLYRGNVNPVIRKWKLSFHNNDFEKVLSYLIPELIPISYLENYKTIKKKLFFSNWPVSPKNIFTSNNHIWDDTFKIYVAEKKVNTNYIIGQHGGQYGIGKFFPTEDHELKTCDLYLSWGWEKKDNYKIQPIGNLKLNNKKKIKSNGNDILLVTQSRVRYSYYLYSATHSSQWLDYLNDQFEFVNSLNESLFKNLKIRMHPSDFLLSQKERWLEKYPNINFDVNKDISDSIQSCRTYISTYNATTFLESMYYNIPTLIFWNPKYWEMREESVYFFDKLESVNVFHKTPIKAALFLNNNYDHIVEWWQSKDVQFIRKEFCDKFSRENINFTSDLYKTFKK